MDTNDFEEDLHANEMADNQSIESNVEWSDVEDLNLEATELSTFVDPFTVEQVPESEFNVFNDCSSILLTLDGKD